MSTKKITLFLVISWLFSSHTFAAEASSININKKSLVLIQTLLATKKFEDRRKKYEDFITYLKNIEQTVDNKTSLTASGFIVYLSLAKNVDRLPEDCLDILKWIQHAYDPMGRKKGTPPFYVDRSKEIVRALCGKSK